MKILVSGANGFIGRALCPYLEAQGHTVVAVVRRPGTLESARVVQDETSWRAALESCDAVVHLAGRAQAGKPLGADPMAALRQDNVQATQQLATLALAAGVRRFVLVSTAKVHGEASPPEKPFTADDAPAPQDGYALSKWEAEQTLRKVCTGAAMEPVILRPPLVYGPGVKGNFASLVKWTKIGLPLPLGCVHNARSMVAVDNLVHFVELCCDPQRSAAAAHQVFFVTDGGAAPSTREVLRQVALAYRVPSRLVPVPARWLERGAHWLGRGAVAQRLLGSLVLDDSKNQRLLGWTPPVTMDEQLQTMAQYDAKSL